MRLSEGTADRARAEAHNGGMRRLATWTLALSALALSSLEAAAATPPPEGQRNCFLSTQWQGWSSAENGDVLYFRILLDDIYRVELVPGSRVRKFGDNFLVNQVRGSAWICTPLDLYLTLSDTQGFRRPVLVKGLRKLTPEEVAAIPKKELPY